MWAEFESCWGHSFGIAIDVQVSSWLQMIKSDGNPVEDEIAYLSVPLSPNLDLLSTAFSPFGSIDINHVPVPLSLLTLTRTVLKDLSTVLAKNGTSCQKQFNSHPVMGLMQPMPMNIKPDAINVDFV
ncbi:hypothetical protein THRCLA_05290 [Thraustotheca clavata]|uniref:Uncharacterized protein n=1 Tax=Thraustotheca clavata TaxID=74557 RepID=A0A1V9ZWC6_9STRA|nr:hypothetical protein THRCLA_05290 [Thraustotheca clavata]